MSQFPIPSQSTPNCLSSSQLVQHFLPDRVEAANACMDIASAPFLRSCGQEIIKNKLLKKVNSRCQRIGTPYVRGTSTWLSILRESERPLKFNTLLGRHTLNTQAASELQDWRYHRDATGFGWGNWSTRITPSGRIEGWAVCQSQLGVRHFNQEIDANLPAFEKEAVSIIGLLE